MAVILFTLSKCLHTDRSFKLWYQFVLHVISLKVCVSGKTYANLCFVTLSTGGLKSVIKTVSVYWLLSRDHQCSLASFLSTLRFSVYRLGPVVPSLSTLPSFNRSRLPRLGLATSTLMLSTTRRTLSPRSISWLERCYFAQLLLIINNLFLY